MKKLMLIVAVVALCVSCHTRNEETTATPQKIDYAQVAVPEFNADSAYGYVAAQLAFGNRIPGSKAWEGCGDYLVRQMSLWCDTVMVQTFKSTLWDGTVVPGRNIVASMSPDAEQRVMLAAHWDSRLWADHDGDESKHRQPVPGANDGASGVAVLMEMARVMKLMPPSVGVDFVFFDVEDQGIPEWADVYEDNTWCKGSQHWGKNRHVPYYSAVYGILLDMVGAHQPRFTKEQVSRHYAPGLTDKLWAAAAALGYGNVFVNQSTDPILDDHLYVNQLAGIPMADIVQNSVEGNFFTHWHTTTDNLDAVSPETLRLVANVVLKTIYADYPTK